MINVEQWRKCAKGVFNSIIIIMLCSVIGNVFSVIGNVQNALSTLQGLASNNSVDMGLSTIDILEITCTLLVIAGYAMYLYNLSAFAKVQDDEVNHSAINRIRNGLIWSIVAIITNFIAGWLSFIFSTIAFFIIIGGYSRLKHSATFPAEARKGAGILYASMIIELIGNILDFIPLVGGLMYLLFSIIAFCMVLRGWSKIKNADVINNTSIPARDLRQEESHPTAIPSEKQCFTTEDNSNSNIPINASGDSETTTNKSVPNICSISQTKPILLSTVALILIATGIYFLWGGNSNKLDVKLPTWQKFVCVNNNDVNLRKAPNTDSPRLMTEPGEMNDIYLWSDAPAGYSTRKPFRLSKGHAVPVISETDEWYHVYIYDYECGDVQAYIMKTFCIEITPIPISNNGNIHKITTGMFEGKYLLYNPGGFYGEEPSISLGEEINGGGYVFPDFPHPLSHTVPYVGDTCNFEQFTDEQLEMWFGEAIKQPVETYSLYYNFGNSNLQTIKVHTKYTTLELK